jgi:hypothetical protein
MERIVSTPIGSERERELDQYEQRSNQTHRLRGSGRFEYFEKPNGLLSMPTYRKTRNITPSTALVSVPRDALDVERGAREDLSA